MFAALLSVSAIISRIRLRAFCVLDTISPGKLLILPQDNLLAAKGGVALGRGHLK